MKVFILHILIRGANNNRKLRRPASVPLAAQVPPPRGPQQLPMT